MILRFFLAAFAAAIFASCAGYQLGGGKPEVLSKVNRLYFPLVKNHTLFPRAEALATNTVADVLAQDGTYLPGTSEQSDATLLVTLSNIQYSQARSSVQDTVRSEELEMTVTLDWRVVDPMLPGDPIMDGSVEGSTRFFAGGNLQTARSTALPDALQRAAEELVARITTGY